MSKNTMTIAFPNGGILPASVTGDKERNVAPHEAVKVPRDYGEHLVHDRFAYEATEKKASAKGGQKMEKPSELAQLEKAVKEAEEGLDKADGDDAKAAAEAVLKDAQDALAAAKG